MEEEQTSSVFHARPIPTSLLKSPKIKPRLLKSAHGSLQSNKSNKSEEQSSNFKARPATVLNTKPFVPKKVLPKPIKIAEFALCSENRAKDREKFVQLLRDREARMEENKRMQEEKRLLKEKEEIARIRKGTVRQAEPIRHYKDPKPVPARPLTQPRSPQFSAMRKNLTKNY